MSAEVHTDLARVAEALRAEFMRKLGMLRNQIADVDRVARAAGERAEELRGRLDEADARLTRAGEAHDELERRADRGLRSARQAIARLTGEVQLIEGRLRMEHGVQPVDLDSLPSGMEGLIDEVREAEELRSGMLDPAAREAHRAALDAYTELERLLADSRRRAFEASCTVARARVGRRGFRRAAATYRIHRGRWRAREAELAARADEAAAAWTALDLDGRLQEQYDAHRGASAVLELAAHLRGRVDAAVETHALFPAWFTITELGHRPSAARGAQWRDVATQVLLYRLTYGITHGVLALGDPPEGGRQAERYHAVRAALKQLEE
ncbi:hypothetical protein [Actinoplanes sp. NPDC049316]|uniref:hypothetical protein n=1 Tax=Actinoplanes sp. NPDC049316 TaxID=3154727 RepID=UPI00342EB73B